MEQTLLTIFASGIVAGAATLIAVRVGQAEQRRDITHLVADVEKLEGYMRENFTEVKADIARLEASYFKSRGSR